MADILIPDGYNMFDDAQGTKKELGYVDNEDAKIYHQSRKGLYHVGIFREKVGRTRSSPTTALIILQVLKDILYEKS